MKEFKPISELELTLHVIDREKLITDLNKEASLYRIIIYILTLSLILSVI